MSSAARRVERDWFDKRDLVYTPRLTPLSVGNSTLKKLTSALAGWEGASLLVRNQGNAGTCTGQALAHLVDLIKIINAPKSAPEPVSAKMLFEMALAAEFPRPGGDVQTLRSVLKGFWHNGVCTLSEWPDTAIDDDNQLTVKRAKSARQTSIGAYYRVRTLLHDFHSAISEAGAVLVAAKTHGGWCRDSDLKHGEIKFMSGSADAHAFVVVGYDEKGFIILNSWGPTWASFDGRPGFARWSYADWAANVMDAWVLQLAASVPDAFELTREPQGLFGGLLSVEEEQKARAAVTPPRAALIGHYAHLEDGAHVVTGTFPSSRGDVERTVEVLTDKAKAKPKPLVLWFAGGAEGSDQALITALKRKQFLEKKYYFYSVLSCQDAIDATRPVLELLFQKAMERSGPGPGLAAAIEATTRGIGRAVWRDLRNAATRSSAPDGDAWHCVDAFVRALDADGERVPIHLVADGWGAVLIGELLRRAWRIGVWNNAFASLTMIGPAIAIPRFEKDVLAFFSPAHADRISVFLPSRAFQDRMMTGPYPGSILQLVRMAFEDRDTEGQPPIMLGQHEASGSLKSLLPSANIVDIAPDKGSPLALEHAQFTGSERCLKRLIEILGAKTAAYLKEGKDLVNG